MILVIQIFTWRVVGIVALHSLYFVSILFLIILLGTENKWNVNLFPNTELWGMARVNIRIIIVFLLEALLANYSSLWGKDND
jgi:hypothetical protein